MPQAVPSDLKDEKCDTFTCEILGTLQNDEIGITCKTDETIKLIGRRAWARTQKKAELKQENIRSTRETMRKIGELFHTNKEISGRRNFEVKEMFNVTNYEILEDAIKHVTEKQVAENKKELKYGKKHALFHTNRHAARAVIWKATIDSEEETITTVSKFLTFF